MVIFPSYLKDLFVTTGPEYELRNHENKLVLLKRKTNLVKTVLVIMGLDFGTTSQGKCAQPFPLTNKFRNDIGRHSTL